MEIKKITPILLVDEIEPCLPFWVERLGFEKTTEVPHEDRIGFAILHFKDTEVMYQTFDSVRADIPAVADAIPPAGAVLFIEVDDIDATERAVAGHEIVVPRRKTFYGADELFVREPGGHLVGFAQFGG
jgi:uncharacterized glyoxalase superfamily protein PhnB